MQPRKIVMHYKDGRIIKGRTGDFSQEKAVFHVHRLDGKMEKVRIEDLKAIFFVRDIQENRDHPYRYDDLTAGGGNKIRVCFGDGKIIVGYASAYSPEARGFLMRPADARGNNEQAYIVKSATRAIEFLTRDEKRRYYRAKTENIISYESFQEGSRSVESGIGRTLDISKGGMLLETVSPISAGEILLSATDSKEQLIHIRGKVAYCREKDWNIYHSGINFTETTEKVRQVVTEMIRAFLQTKMAPETDPF